MSTIQVYLVIYLTSKPFCANAAVPPLDSLFSFTEDSVTTCRVACWTVLLLMADKSSRLHRLLQAHFYTLNPLPALSESQTSSLPVTGVHYSVQLYRFSLRNSNKNVKHYPRCTIPIQARSLACDYTRCTTVLLLFSNSESVKGSFLTPNIL